MSKTLKLFAVIFLILIIAANTINGSSASDSEIGNLRAQGIVLLDQDGGDILYSKNPHKKMYPASTTKILTTLVALKNCDLEDIVTVGAEITHIDPQASKADLFKDQRISLKNLIRALMLPSGSDAAHAIAVYVGRQSSGNDDLSIVEAQRIFMQMMNTQAQKLGAKNSNFINPDGIHHAKHYSTAYDLAVIAREAMKNDFFREVVSAPAYEWNPGSGANISRNGQKVNPRLFWKNTNQLLQPDSPFYDARATGIKTGFTSQAGYCLASAASKDGKHILTVVLNSTESGVWTDTLQLFDYGFTSSTRVQNAETGLIIAFSRSKLLILAAVALPGIFVVWLNHRRRVQACAAMGNRRRRRAN